MVIDLAVPPPPSQVPPPQESTPPRSTRSRWAMAAVLLIGAMLGVFALDASGAVYSVHKADSSVAASFSRIGQLLGGDAADTPYTNSKYGVSALLPGTDWDNPRKISGSYGESIWRNDN